MKDIVTKINESKAPEYLLAKVVACDTDTSDYILASIDTDVLPKSLSDKIIKLAGTGKVDTAMLCYKNVAKEDYKNMVTGKIIDVDPKTVFIATGPGDGIDEDQLNRGLFKNCSWAKGDMKENGYVLTGSLKEDHGKKVELDKMKKLKTSMIE